MGATLYCFNNVLVPSPNSAVRSAGCLPLFYPREPHESGPSAVVYFSPLTPSAAGTWLTGAKVSLAIDADDLGQCRATRTTPQPWWCVPRLAWRALHPTRTHGFRLTVRGWLRSRPPRALRRSCRCACARGSTTSRRWRSRWTTPTRSRSSAPAATSSTTSPWSSHERCAEAAAATPRKGSTPALTVDDGRGEHCCGRCACRRSTRFRAPAARRTS